jgi:hypothetical protein
MAILLLALLGAAALGMFLGLVAHVTALLGLPQPLGSVAWFLHLGVFMVWIPAFPLSIRFYKRKEFWTAAWHDCPLWMKWMVFSFFIYAIVSFCLGSLLAARGGANAPQQAIRAFSGHWMLLYSAAVAIYYSAFRITRRDTARRCLNGHSVAPSASFCYICGASLVRESILESEGEP